MGKGKQPLLRYFLVRPAIDCLKLRAAACTAEGRLRRLPNLFIKAGKVAMCFDMHGM
ncbi:8-oxo-dGTP pyrophosphatase MutT and related house-cleaning NTP pyrophosphohydrolase [Pseudomonas syringae pv. actinidiae]|uniref:8-oxo-dGTP pyrophosphatase MutT and related house-cleaning NTP pyrophosphohydrolase n=1 Tax=Pseudomonas syringae pv. actinidiae TaxID=103796 RepID=A0AAN4QAC3_PSESF|nr:8-oxo-dGTP pyrophosphatase MutT and related house-cleaning NTP pyrophosphohydrolase [Pseudomonas syringae pv. actinidiae]